MSRDKPIRIAIVEDHSIFRDGIKMSLRKLIPESIEIVFEAADGQSAIEEMKSFEPDVILMDTRMPVLDGIAATLAIVRDYPKVKVLALSSFDDSGTVNAMLEVGASGFVVKNVTGQQLYDAIEKVHSGHFYLSPELSDHILDETSPNRIEPAEFLSDREREIIRIICSGKKTKEVAAVLSLSKRTIDRHRENIMEKLGVNNFTDVVTYAIKNGIYEP